MTPDQCSDCERPLHRSHKPCPEGLVRHHSHGMCSGCLTAFKRRHGVPLAGPRKVQPRRDPKKDGPVAPLFATRRLPAAPLLDFVRVRGLSTSGDAWVTVRRAADSGHITFSQADRVATRLLGVHPASIWGPVWFADEGAA